MTRASWLDHGAAAGLMPRRHVSIDGSGDAQLSGLTARNVDAVINGSGAIFVTATQSLDAKVPGSGAVLYGGNPPHVTTSITGSGAVTPG
jgi:Putative auto-transporter adhesin, head GIN domain